MLSFSIEDSNFVVTQRIHGFTKTDVMTVTYTPDISQKQVNVEGWRQTTPEDREWFWKHHSKHFEKLLEVNHE